MKRGTSLISNVSKLNTFIYMAKSNELLSIYIEKILNNRSKSLKFVNDFDYVSLDLLYTSLQIMANSKDVSKEDFSKIDKKELKYYLDKVKGMNYFKRQVPSIKNEEVLINYLKSSLADGEYVCKSDNTVLFDNGLVVDANWLIEFSSFLITSLNNNANVSKDGMIYYFNTIIMPSIENVELKTFLKDITLYEYSVKRKDEKKLSFQDIKYLIDILSPIEEYDFKKMQEINSNLAKENYTLSINKKKATFNKDEKLKIDKLFNEKNDESVLIEYIKDILKCNNSKANKNKRKLIDTYEIIRSLVHAYKCNMSIFECRKKFNLDERKSDIMSALTIASFYINYIYDSENINKFFDYSILNLDNLKPTIIDYETPEYKSIISELSKLNKRVVIINRRINNCLDNARRIPKRNIKMLEENSSGLLRNCSELEQLVNRIKFLRNELKDIKDDNRNASNINKTKLSYIKEAINNGRFDYNSNTTNMTFDCYSSKDYHHTFHLEISLKEFMDIILSDHNRHTRIDFYQI